MSVGTIASTIAIDMHGGDHGIEVTVPAVLTILEQDRHTHLLLVGQEPQLLAALESYGFCLPHPRIHLQHAEQLVAMDEHPFTALRYKKQSSMRLSIAAVKEGQAKACVSAGNTGALVAIAHYLLKTQSVIEHAGLMALFPTQKEDFYTIVCDLGAHIEAEPYHLYQYALMAHVYAETILNRPKPKIALLNIGVEPIKGHELVKKTAELLENSNLNYVGYTEGDGVFAGEIDIVVCDGFTGNVLLKTSEGVSRMLSHAIKKQFHSSLFSKAVSVLCKTVLNKVSEEYNPARYNGATLIGMNGIVVKSHGNANVDGFANAIMIAAKQADAAITARIHHAFQLIHPEEP